MTDYEKIVEQIRKDGYIPKHGLQNLVLNVLACYEEEFTIEGCAEYVYASGGWKEFDYEL